MALNVEITGAEDADGEASSIATNEGQKLIAAVLGNQPGLSQLVYTTSAADTPEALPSRSVPDGVDVLVEYREANSGTVYVGGSETQQSPLQAVGQGRTFAVSDTSAIHVRAPTAGDGVVVTFESNGGSA